MMHSLNSRILTISTIVIFAGFFSSNFKSQTRSYTAENLDYVLVLPTAQWREGRIQTITQSAAKSKTSGLFSETITGKENKPTSREGNAKQKRYGTGIALAYTLLLAITMNR
jgi:hypothetical protein